MLSGRNKSACKLLLKSDDGTLIEDERNCTEAFNSYFSSIGIGIKNSINSLSHSYIPVTVPNS